MSSHDYTFVTRWRVEGTREEVSNVLEDVASMPGWWPAVYLDAREVSPGDAGGIGRTIALWTRGWLPYTLRWQSRLAASRRPAGFSIEATGDFVGAGDWTFTQDAEYVDVVFEWRIRAEKPLLRYLSFLLKPAFAANHRWAMARGEESLKRELALQPAALRRGGQLQLALPVSR